MKSVSRRRTNIIWFHSYGEYKKIVEGIIGERRENEWEKSERETEHERLLTLGNEQGVVEGEVGGGTGDWVTGTEGGTWRDEHWLLYYMLANQTPIKKYKKIK